MSRSLTPVVIAAALCLAMTMPDPARSGTLGQSKQIFVTSTREIGADGGYFCTRVDEFRQLLRVLYDRKIPDPLPGSCRSVAPGGTFTTRWLSWIDEPKGLVTSDGALGAEKGYFVGQFRP
jgi:hypothetical protein